MKKLLLLMLSVPMMMWAQTTREEIYTNPQKAGGVYYAYPVTESMNTPVPKGYEPFYVSHYGRHGSRYLISDDDYLRVVNLLNMADSLNALTPLGVDLCQRLDQVWEEAQGLGGELTPLGQRQHHDIAQRMYNAFPQVFAGEPEVTATSTTIMRCAHSMFAFIEGLKELNPNINIPRQSGQRTMDYMNYHSPESGKYSGRGAEYYLDYKKFEDEMVQPERLVKSIFSDSLFVRRHVDPKAFMRDLYWIAVDLQNMETEVSMMDIFTPDELFDIWQIYNFSFYAGNSSFPLADGQHVDNAKNLLKNILETADQYIEEGKNGATLRFGHDGNIIPLAALMQIPGAVAYETNPYELYTQYANYKISPMASNIQIIFFKDKKGDVIVKFMLNEREVSIPAQTDMFPFYRWEDARAVLQTILDTPSREYIPASSIK